MTRRAANKAGPRCRADSAWQRCKSAPGGRADPPLLTEFSARSVAAGPTDIRENTQQHKLSWRRPLPVASIFLRPAHCHEYGELA